MFKRDFKAHDLIVDDNGFIEVQMSYVEGFFNLFGVRTNVTLVLAGDYWINKNTMETMDEKDKMVEVAINFIIHTIKWRNVNGKD